MKRMVLVFFSVFLVMTMVATGLCEEAAQGDGAEVTAEEAEQITISTFQYTVNPIKPENQTGESGGYNLRMEPGQEQTIEVDVTNTGTEDIVVTADVFTAFSNSNGVIQYSETDREPDATQLYDVSEIVKADQPSITIAPGETEKVTFSIEMPEEEYDGILMGGLVFAREPSESELQTSAMGIVNVYSYVLGIRLHETDAEIEPAFEVLDIIPNIATVWGPQMEIQLRNPVALLARQMTLVVELYAADDLGTPVHEHTNNAIEFAPNTMMPYILRMDQDLPEGDYLAKIVLTYEDEEFAFEKEFTVGAEAAE